MVNPSSILRDTLKAIKQVGLVVSFTSSTDGSYDPETGKRTGKVSTSHELWSTPPLDYRTFYKTRESSAKSGVSVIVVPATDPAFTPSIGNCVNINGEDWFIGTVAEHSVKTTTIAFVLEIYRG